MTPRTVLFPVDLSDECRRLIPYATDVARKERAKLLFLFVDREPVDEGALITGHRSRYWEELQAWLPSDPGIVYEHRIVGGLVADAILHTARQTGANLIVMRGRRRRILPPLFGGTHDAVLRNAPCPVLVLRSEVAESAAELAFPILPMPEMNVA